MVDVCLLEDVRAVHAGAHDGDLPLVLVVVVAHDHLKGKQIVM